LITDGTDVALRTGGSIAWGANSKQEIRVMVTSSIPLNRKTLSRRLSSIRTSWTLAARRRRAANGERRFEEFLELAGLTADHDAQAVGALTLADIKRLAR
jgi:hypothetical protein